MYGYINIYNFLFAFSDTYGLKMAILCSQNLQLAWICYKKKMLIDGLRCYHSVE